MEPLPAQTQPQSSSQPPPLQPRWRPTMASLQLPQRCPKMASLRPEWCAKMERAQRICIAVVSLFSIIFICLVATIIWLSFLPNNMRYSIEHGSIDGYSFANDTLNANFHFLLQASNPNSGFAIYYNGVTVTVWFEGTSMLSYNSTVPAFHQPSKNITHVSLDSMAKDVKINGTAARDLSAEWDSGDVALDLSLKAKIVLKFGSFKIHRGLKVHCKGLKVSISSSKGQFDKVACRKHVYD